MNISINKMYISSRSMSKVDTVYNESKYTLFPYLVCLIDTVEWDIVLLMENTNWPWRVCKSVRLFTHYQTWYTYTIFSIQLLTGFEGNRWSVGPEDELLPEAIMFNDERTGTRQWSRPWTFFSADLQTTVQSPRDTRLVYSMPSWQHFCVLTVPAIKNYIYFLFRSASKPLLGAATTVAICKRSNVKRR